MRDKNNGPLIRIAVIIAVITVVSVFTPVRDLPPVVAVQSAVFRVVYPVQFVFFKFFSFIGGAGRDLVSLRRAQKENERLRRELAVHRSVSGLFSELVKENGRLRSLAGFSARNTYGIQLIPAEVISRSPSSWFSSVVLDRGSSDGVKNGKAVVSPQGLIGRVVEVHPNSCKVLLILDENSSVSVMLPRISEIGVMAGRGGGDPQLKYISSTSDVRDGDIAVTSGTSDYYPRGIPVGRVSGREKKDFDLFHNIRIKTDVNFSDLGPVFIVK